MPLNSQTNIYQQVPQALIPRSTFDRSFSHRFSCDADYLIPGFRDEILPGDTINLKNTTFARLATQIVPIMDNAYVEWHFWFVPRRLVWKNWQKFMGERRNPNDSIDYLIPQATTPTTTTDSAGNTYAGILPGTICDYLGVRPNIAGISFDACYLRAYNLIYNEWYRDQNLQNSVYCPDDDGPDTIGNYTLLKRGKRGDYFTTGFTQPQKGPAVSINLGESAPVIYGPLSTSLYTNNMTNSTNYEGAQVAITNSTSQSTASMFGYEDSTGTQAAFPLIAKLSDAVGATVNSLRDSLALQQFLEKDMIGGTRYIESIYSHFGVVSPDARLQRPEFLGSFVSSLNQTTVAQTSQTTQGSDASPQANLSAYSTFAVQGNNIKHSFTEHGILLGIMNIRADLSYQYGLDRELSRRTRFDFFWPELQHLGMQAVLKKEVFCDGTSVDEEAFNYQMRYDEYRFKNSRISGLLRSGVTDAAGNSISLDYWTLAEDYKDANGTIQRPEFNAQFIESNTPFARVIAVQNEPQFIVDADFEYYHTRPMAVYGTPGLSRI